MEISLILEYRVLENWGTFIKQKLMSLGVIHILHHFQFQKNIFFKHYPGNVFLVIFLVFILNSHHVLSPKNVEWTF